MLHYERQNIQQLIILKHKADKWVKPYMVSSQGRYLDVVGKKGVKLHPFVSNEVFIINTYHFQDTVSPTSMGR